MVYIIVFLAGAAAAASGLLIAYYGGLLLLRREKESLTTWHDRLTSDSSTLAQKANDLENRRKLLNEEVVTFEARKVQYDGLVRENSGLKQDLFNLSVQLKKTERDHAALTQRQSKIDGKANELAERYLKENVSWIGDKLNSTNFSSCKQRLLKVIGSCRAIGFEVPEEKEQELIQDLQKSFEQAVRDEFAREEQARIKAQIREEEKLARERAKAVEEAKQQDEDKARVQRDAEQQVAAMREALENALKTTKDEHSIEVDFYKMKLKEAEEKRAQAEQDKKETEERLQRAISNAQLVKCGHVYVLSNIGSFGEGVFKIGMTRRDQPEKRVDELGDASVPFPFDVHMMIYCDNAPALENALHKEFHHQRMNKVKLRKEFFRVDLDSIRKVVESQNAEVKYVTDVAEAAALQYRESATMTDEDYEFVEHTVESVTGGDGDSPEDE